MKSIPVNVKNPTDKAADPLVVVVSDDVIEMPVTVTFCPVAALMTLVRVEESSPLD